VVEGVCPGWETWGHRLVHHGATVRSGLGRGVPWVAGGTFPTRGAPAKSAKGCGKAETQTIYGSRGEGGAGRWALLASCAHGDRGEECRSVRHGSWVGGTGGLGKDEYVGGGREPLSTNRVVRSSEWDQAERWTCGVPRSPCGSEPCR